MKLLAPPVLQLPEALLFWAVFLWVFLPESRLILRSRRQLSSPQDAGTMRLIVVGSNLALLVGVAASLTPFLALPWPRAALFAGTGLLFLGGLLRRVCFRALGSYFTGAVVVTPGQPVIESGPYRWVRHPSYTAGCLVFLGIGVALGNALSVAALLLGPVLVYLRRVEAEESALLSTIGEPYRAYVARTKRFIPFIV